MHTSGILRFDESVNDMSFFSHFKYTSKGPHSLGGKNSNNIGVKYRDIHPSFLGRLDILVCGNSDPGTSGLLSPFGDINGFYSGLFPENDNIIKKLYLPNIPIKIEELKKILSYKYLTHLTLYFVHFNDEYYEAFLNNYDYPKMEEIRIILYNNYDDNEKKKEVEEKAKKYYNSIKNIISQKSKYLNKFEFLKSKNYLPLIENETEIKDLYSKFKYLVEPSLYYLFKP